MKFQWQLRDAYETQRRAGGRMIERLGANR